MDAVKEMLKWLERSPSLQHLSWHSRFSLIVEIWFRAITRSEERYLEIVKEIGKPATREAAEMLGKLIVDMHQDPRDILGKVYQEYAVHSKYMAQYFTPDSVADCMAQMNLHDLQIEYFTKSGGLKVQEPCCGSGVMCISTMKAIVNEYGKDMLKRVGLYMIDKDITCCWMAYLQVFWFPGMLGGAYLWHGDTLGNPADLKLLASFGNLHNEPRYTNRIRKVIGK